MTKNQILELNLENILKQYIKHKQVVTDYDYDKITIINELLEALQCEGHAELINNKLKTK
tara:strand:+ start:310 stop:489 length:180 start_codon:yes stop_codon:yes gene_type:complete